MASKYDQPDAPDTDRYEDKPIDVADEPKDGELWAERLTVREHMERLAFGILAGIDPADHAHHTALDVLQTFEVELAKASTPARAEALLKHLRAIEKAVSRVASAASDKVDSFQGGPF